MINFQLLKKDSAVRVSEVTGSTHRHGSVPVLLQDNFVVLASKVKENWHILVITWHLCAYCIFNSFLNKYGNK
jgi:hypothetical protein